MTKAVILRTVDDAAHFTPEMVEEMKDEYPATEHRARLRGLPVLGSGRVYPYDEEDVVCDAFECPPFFRRLGAVDIGYSQHPFAAVEGWHDVDTDILYIAKEYRQKHQTPAMVAASLKHWGPIRWAWPRDAANETAAGPAVAKQLSDEGLQMLPEHAQFEDERGYRVEPGIMLLTDRMKTGRLKVFRHLRAWFSEFVVYHRENGLIVKEVDDLMDATRYLVMMLRYGRTTDWDEGPGGPSEQNAEGPNDW